ncbi:transposase [Caballeronia fortuita]|uniref:transposase n=1 Tax=Caballeronia fortuita TaxID=1777138 RepID=UPI0009419C36
MRGLERQRHRRAHFACARLWQQRGETQTHQEHFGWGKTVSRLRQTVYRGIVSVNQHFKLTMLASNLKRMARILTALLQGCW